MVVDVLCVYVCVVCMFGCDDALYNQGYVIKRWLTREVAIYVCFYLFVGIYQSSINYRFVCLLLLILVLFPESGGFSHVAQSCGLARRVVFVVGQGQVID